MKRTILAALAGLAITAPAAQAQTIQKEQARAQRSAERACRTLFAPYGCIRGEARLIAAIPHRLVFWQELVGGLNDVSWRATRAYARVDNPRRPGGRRTITTTWRCVYSDQPTKPPEPCFDYGGGELPGEFGGGRL